MRLHCSLYCDSVDPSPCRYAKEINKDQRKKKNNSISYHIGKMILRQLHLHVISTDFCSDTLRSKTHYNAFTTRFLITPQEVLQVLYERGSFYLTPQEIHDYRECKYLPLRCNQCDMAHTSLQVLKIHLQTHLDERVAAAQRRVPRD